MLFLLCFKRQVQYNQNFWQYTNFLEYVFQSEFVRAFLVNTNTLSPFHTVQLCCTSIRVGVNVWSEVKSVACFGGSQGAESTINV